MPLLSLDEFRSKAGFPVDDLIRQVKNELGVAKVRCYFDNPWAQAMSRYNVDGALEIHLPTLEIILQQRPELTREEAIAKIKAQVAEEICVSDEAMVISNPSLTEMRDIPSHEWVYSGKGFQRPEAFSTREYNGQIVGIKCAGFPEIRVTALHPVKVVRRISGGTVRGEWVTADELKEGMWVYMPLAGLFKSDTKQHAADITRLPWLWNGSQRGPSKGWNRRLKMAVSRKWRSKMNRRGWRPEWNYQIAKFVGLWIGDGCVSNTKPKGSPPNYKISIYMNSRDQKLIPEISLIVKTQFKRTSWTTLSDGGSCTVITFADKELALWLRQTFGKSARTKTIPVQFLKLPVQIAEGLLDGLLASDGYYSKTRREWQYGTISRSLAYTVALLGIKLGYLPQINKNKSIMRLPDRPSTGKESVYYSINLNRDRRYQKLVGENVLSQIRHLSIEHGKMQVASLKMSDGRPTYITPPLMSHNCHGKFRETDHTDQVVSCTINAMKRHLTPAELEYPYIQEKTSRLRGASNTIQGTPIRR